jgi:hypothetical protein
MITVQYDKTIFQGVIIAITDAPKKILDFAEKKIPPLLRKEITPLTTEPREPTLPFIWSYDPGENRRLRAAYFRKIPKGSRGGRYRRTHKLVQAWQTGSIRSATQATFSVRNDVPYLDTVQGDEQYPSHKDSGWVQYDGVLIVAGEKAIDTVTVGWLNILD